MHSKELQNKETEAQKVKELQQLLVPLQLKPTKFSSSPQLAPLSYPDAPAPLWHFFEILQVPHVGGDACPVIIYRG